MQALFRGVGLQLRRPRATHTTTATHLPWAGLTTTHLHSPPVLVNHELWRQFELASQQVAPFGDGKLTIADHCLQVATDVYHNEDVPESIRRDMVVMSLFHDVFFLDSRDAHGVMVAPLLEEVIDPDVLQLLEVHTDIGCGLSAGQGEETGSTLFVRENGKVSLELQEWFMHKDCHTLHTDRSWYDVDFFRERFFTVEPAPRFFTMEPAPPLERKLGPASPEPHAASADGAAAPAPVSAGSAFSFPTCAMPFGDAVIWGAPSMWIERVPLLLATHLKLWQRAGLPEVRLEVCNGGPELLRRVGTGDVHVGEIGLFPFIAAVAAGEAPPSKLVGSTFIPQLDHYLAARKGAGIEQVAELEGRRVGVLSRGSCDTYLLDLLLQGAGLRGVEDVELVPLGARYGQARVLSDGSSVDAAFLVEPALSHAELSGFCTVLAHAGENFPRFQWGGLLASEEVIQEHRASLLQLLEVYREACELMHKAITDPSEFELRKEMLALGPKHLGVPGEVLLAGLSRDHKRWQLDWRQFDPVGASACIAIQERLGAVPTEPSGRSALTVDKLFQSL